MLKRVVCLLAMGACRGPMLQAADNPFAGRWKLNPGKSRMTGQIDSIQSVGADKYQFTRGALSWTLTADGKEQPLPFGGTTTLVAVAPGTWKFTYKVDGKLVSTDHWWLAPDEKSMLRASEGTRLDGSIFDNETKYSRTAGEKGFAGTWKSTKITARTPDEMVILANGDDGITRTLPADNSTVSLKFDGADYPMTGPNVPPGMTLGAERTGHHKIKTTSKLNGKLLGTAEIMVSGDGKRIEILAYDAGVTLPYLMIYDRE